MNLESILEIVDTYELTESQRNYVERNISSRLDRLNDFTTAYSYISELVDFLNVPFGERRALRLDESIENSNTSKTYFFGTDDEILFEKDEEYRKQKISEISLQYLKGVFEPKILEFFTLLILNSGLEPEEYEEVIKKIPESQIPEIAYRLGVLKRGLFDKDEDYIVRGNIEVTSFSPFKIKFRNRRYNGDPLQFYREHQDLYEGMSRKELEGFDSGLARHLRYHSQIKDAIPETKLTNSLSDEEIATIMNSYEDCFGNLKIASEKLGFHRRTIAKYWRKKGLKTYSYPYRFQNNPLAYYQRNRDKFEGKSRSEMQAEYPGFTNFLRECGQLDDTIPEVQSSNKLTDEQISNILKAHKQTNGMVGKASELTGHSEQTISKYWVENGLEKTHKKEKKLERIIKNKKTIKKEEKTSRVIIGNALEFYRAHEKEFKGMSRTELSKAAPGLYQGLLKSGDIQKAIPTNNHGGKVSGKNLEKILSTYIPSEGVLKVASSMVNYSEGTISRYWQENGLEIIGVKLNLEEREEIINSYEKSFGNITYAAKYLNKSRATIAKYWRDAGLKSAHSKVYDNEEKKNMIVAAYKPFKGNADKVAKELGLTNQTITRYWRKAGLEVNSPGRNISQEGIQEILNAYTIDNGIASRAAKRLGRDFYTITKYWDEAGFEVRIRKIKKRK